MNDNLYSFETYKGYSVVVEKLDTDEYEGVGYVHSYHNPEFVFKDDNPEWVRSNIMRLIDEKVED